MSELAKTIRKGRSAYRVLAPFGRQHRAHLAQGALATVVLVAARLAFPWPLRGLMEIVFQGHAGGRHVVVARLVPAHADPVVWLLGLFVVIVLVWGMAESFQRLAFTRFAIGTVHDVRNRAVRRVSQGRTDASPGELIATITGDTGRLKNGITSVLIGITRNGLFFLGVAAIITLIDPVVGLVFLVGGVATAVAGGLGAAHSMSISKRSRAREDELADELHRFLAGQSELGKPSRRKLDPDSKARRLEGTTTFVVHLILAVTTCAMLVLTIDRGRSGQLSPGAVFTVLAYVILMHNKMVGLGRSIVRVGRVVPSAKRLSVLVRGKRTKPEPPGRPMTVG